MPPVPPLYAQLKDLILNAIARGELGPGEQLPSQRELGDKYGMSHMTVRRAINELINEGAIYAISGKGIFVGTHKVDAEAGPLISFTEDVARRGMSASSKIITAEIVNASPILARGLGVEPHAPLVYLYRLRLADGQPMALQASYLPHRLCPGLLKHDLESGSLYAILRDVYGLRLADSTGAVEAALASDEQAALLGVPLPSAVLVTEQITFLDDGLAIEFVRATLSRRSVSAPIAVRTALSGVQST